ncbi:hypothetical protein [Methylophilus sp. Leaf414]|uniref:hypothetical protein n=1 Tax=Methylophilus sp. Leaf414 TaxID=1736371 RepID=UPI0006F3AA54|nr:hypothetical protein [Methylophilus sp. Leaf414]KQT36282.1 hypothetical protein ASG24_08485 [Methylophilus sp. Leaf414]
MRRLVLNHAHGKAPGPGPLLLGVALLVLSGLLLAFYIRLADENAALKLALAARQAVTSPVAKTITAQSLATHQALAAELAEAQLKIQTPWIPLLNTLEKVQQPQLYWMQLAPDAKRKHIRMTVLAPHRQQGWALVERLKRQAGLADVKLNASESTDVNGLIMTTLHLEAGWQF